MLIFPGAVRRCCASSAARPMRWRCVPEPGGHTAFRSNFNSNMLTHPARGQALDVASTAAAVRTQQRRSYV